MSQFVNGLQKLLLLHNSRFIRKASYNVSKEIVQQTPAAHVDLLFTNLRYAKSVPNVLELVSSHHQIMNNKHAIQALRSLFALQKSCRGEVTSQDILNHVDFERLCGKLRQQAGIMDQRDTIDALKILSYLGVSSDTLICQVLLQLIRQSINNLSLRQIIFVDFLLKQMKSSPLVDALQIALPIVFEVQLPIKMDRSKITILAEYLQFVSKKDVSEKCIGLIVDAIVSNNDQWEAKAAFSILWSICDLKPSQHYKEVLSKALRFIMNDIESTSYEILDVLLSKLVYRYSNKLTFYYDEEYFNAVASLIIENNLGFEPAVYTYRKYLKLNHVHNELLDYISEKCHLNPDLIISGDPLHVYVIITSVALTEYRPKYWASLQKAIESIDFDNYFDKDFLLNLATSLSILDVYKADTLKKCLDIEILRHLFNKSPPADFDNVLLLYQAVKTFKPELSDLLPDESFMKQMVLQSSQTKDFPLEGSLHKILGGERYVKTNVKTMSFHHIDHVVLLRKGGYPAAINITTDKGYLEDLEVTPDSRLVLIFAMKPSHYTLNSRRLKGSTWLMIKTLEARGYSVVPISLELWSSLPEYERLPYIAEAIKGKTDQKERSSDFMS